jgi:histone-binding protein RBBP4
MIYFESHNSIVEDVTWNNFDEYVFLTVGDDKKLRIWDTRSPQTPTSSIEGHV